MAIFYYRNPEARLRRIGKVIAEITNQLEDREKIPK